MIQENRYTCFQLWNVREHRRKLLTKIQNEVVNIVLIAFMGYMVSIGIIIFFGFGNISFKNAVYEWKSGTASAISCYIGFKIKPLFVTNNINGIEINLNI